MAGLIKCFKHIQKKDKLDTSTLPDTDGPLSRDISSSSIGPCAPSATGNIKRKEITRAIYFAN